MKILVVCQYYYPEPFRIPDLCEALVEKGHEVVVLTGIPNYPEGIVYEGYRDKKKRNEVINGVQVHRCFTIARKKGVIFRFLNYYSYALSSSLAVLMNKYKPSDGGEFDVVFVNQLSPVMMAYAGIRYKKMHHKKLVMYCLDLWPESLVAGGVGRDSLIYRMFYKISKSIYRKCDCILVTSRMFKDYMTKEFGIDSDKIQHLPQYAEQEFENIRSNPSGECFNFVFAGNIGEIQSVQTIIEAAERLKENEKIHIHIFGSGTDLDRIKELTKDKKLTNVSFYGRVTVEELLPYYEMADAMLISLADDPIISMTLPGKVQSYMAAGKPIIGAIDGETKRVVEEAECGYIGNAQDPDALAENIKGFISLSDEEKLKLGTNGKNFYLKYYAKNEYINRMERVLKERSITN